MDHGVDQGLPNGLVDKRLILAEEVGAELEGELEIHGEAMNDPLVELKQVPDPCAVDGQPVGPADAGVEGELLPVIDVVTGDGGGVTDGFIFAEHEQTGDGQALLAGASVFAPAPELGEKPTVVQREPRVIGGTGQEPLAVLLEARRVDVVDAEVFQNPAVSGSSD